MRWALGAFWAAVIGLPAAASHDIVAAGPQGLAPRAAPSSSSLDRTLLNKYCFSCHNSRLRTGGLALDSFDVSAVGEHADVWEKVVRKLCGHDSIGPSGVHDQSFARTSLPISPPPPSHRSGPSFDTPERASGKNGGTTDSPGVATSGYVSTFLTPATGGPR